MFKGEIQVVDAQPNRLGRALSKTSKRCSTVATLHASRCHNLNAKMRQIRFRLGLRPRPRLGSLQRSPRPPSWIKGVLLLRKREGKGGGEKRGGRGRERQGRGEREKRKGRVRRRGERREGRRRKGRGGGPSGDVADQVFCLKSAPARERWIDQVRKDSGIPQRTCAVEASDKSWSPRSNAIRPTR